MSYLNDEVFDQGLDYAAATGTKLDICSAEPANFAGIAGVTLGNKDPATSSVPEDADVDGRKVVVSAITDGTVTGTGDAAFWALSNGTAVLVASGTLAITQTVTNGNVFTLDLINVTKRDAVSV